MSSGKKTRSSRAGDVKQVDRELVEVPKPKPRPSTSDGTCLRQDECLQVNVKGMILCDRFRVESKLGVGAFGAVYRVTDLQQGDELALKVEDSNSETKLRFEYEAYTILEGGPCIPRIRFYGEQSNLEMMAMELIGGSLGDLFMLCSGKFSLKTVLIVADKLLETVEFVHGKYLTHGDLKPDNFLISKGELYVVDFGLVRRYWNKKKNQHIFYREDIFRRGCTAFAPARAHAGFERSRRDDMENIALCLVYFLRGELPWMNLELTYDKDWMEEANELKMSTSAGELCQGYPEEFATYLDYCRGLRFEDAPDYNYCRQLFRGLFDKMGYVNDKVYDWDSIIEKMEDLGLKEKVLKPAEDENNTQPSI